MTLPPSPFRTHRQNPALQAALACVLWAAASAQAQTPAGPVADIPASTPAKTEHAAHGWQWGVVLDAGATSRALALGARSQGLQLGHSDLSVSGPVGSQLKAQLTAVAETHDGKLEKAVEEAWLETTSLPLGLQLRGGRFASQVGYQNAQHSHADDFVERPLLYRALLGGHWSDDGLRLNWTVPSAQYLMFGVEAFRGKRLVAEAANAPGQLGAVAFVAKLGDDFNRDNSWQLGLSHIRNRREAALEDAHGHHDEHEDDHDDHGGKEAHGAHAHHGAQFSGRKTWMLDATWKWSPNGNNRQEQLKLGLETARTTGLNRFASSGDRHQSHALSAVWRFNPSWEVGARTDWLKVSKPHGDHFDTAQMREHAVMVVYKPTHMQSVRVQYTTQRDVKGFEAPAKNAVQLQYVLAFGAHGAHPF